eukprot:12506_1
MYHGGGIDAHIIATAYSNNITINNTQFSYNNANYGGGIDAAYSNNITINNTQFNRNNVNYSGGGLSTVASAVTAMNSQFEHNKAFYEGGGIYIDDSSISVIDSVFSGNNAIVAGGGAVSMSISNMLILSSLSIESSSFVDNYGQIGGALLITDTTASSLCKMTNIVNVTFWSNEAISGAALYMYSSCSSIVFNMSYFITNFASNGGTVVLDINYNIPQVMQNTIFDSNVASYDAGAILIYRSNLHIKDCDFISNIAGQNGGAIYVSSLYSSNNELVLYNCLLNDNTADNNGGTIYSEKQTSLIIDSSNVTSNVANNAGGGLYLHGEFYIFDCIFSNNYAFNQGGCISVQNEAFVDVFDTVFINCSSNGIGGALFSISDDISMHFVIFKASDASNGGAIYFAECPSFNNTNLWFQNNSADFGGAAAIINDNDCSMNWCQNCTYENNDAAYGPDIASSTAELIIADRITDMSDIQLKVHQKLQLNISVKILDAYKQIMGNTEYTIVASMQKGDNVSNITLTGITDQTIKNGYANLSFWIEPNESIRYKSISLNTTLQLNIISPSYRKHYKYDVTFVNKLYQTPKWLHIQSYIMFGIICIFNAAIVKMLCKHLNHTIVKNGIQLYLCMILFGTILLSLLFVVFIVDNLTAMWCQITIWTLHLSFIFIIGPICSKICYIWKCTFFSHNTFEGYDGMNVKLFTIICVVMPFITCIIYLIMRMGHQTKWSYWEVNEMSGINAQFCIYNDTYMGISTGIAILVLLWIVQISLNIEDKKGEYNTQIVIIFTAMFIFIMSIFVFDLLQTEAKRSIISIWIFVLILLVQCLVFWTQFYSIWIENIISSDKLSKKEEEIRPQNKSNVAHIEMVNI